MRFDGDIIITDPCYIIKNDTEDWELCEYGDQLENLGFKTFLRDYSRYGDWSCTTFEKDTGKALGEFCADAAQVAVFLLKDVMEYNKDFNYHIERKWTTTWIKDFHGEIDFEIRNEDISVVGTGNINFYTEQTGA